MLDAPVFSAIDAVLETIRARRSAGRLVPPGPAPHEVELLLDAAACAPDHGRLQPWRFVVLEGAELRAFGDVLADAYRAACEDGGEPVHEAAVERERARVGRAPMIIAVVARPTPSEKVPWIEQVEAVAAATQNLLLAATALGYGSMWRTGAAAMDARVKAGLGLEPDDHIVAFVYLGSLPDEGGRRSGG